MDVLTLARIQFGATIGFHYIYPPNLVYSQPGPEHSLTIYNAASSPITLGIMLFMAGIGVPLVIAHKMSIYWIFRAKVKLDRVSY